MNSTELTRIAVKIVAIYLIAQGLMQVPNITAALQYSGSQPIFDSQVLSILTVASITPLVFGIILWIASNKIADFIIRSPDSTELASVSSSEIQAILLSTIGLLILVLAFPKLISLCIQLIAATNQTNEGNNLNIYLLSYLAAEIVKVIFGLSLILRTSGWAKLLQKLRSVGTQ